MPKPKGYSDADLKRRDDCVTKLKAKGVSESSAYAICTASVNKTAKK